MEGSRSVLLWISVISALILNDENGLYGSDMHNQSAQVPYGAPQNAAAGHTMSNVPGQVQNMAQGGVPGFAPTGQLGYGQQAPQNFMQMPQGFMMQSPQNYMMQPPQGFAQNPQGFAQNPQGFAPGAMPMPGYMPPLMPGIDLNKEFVKETLKAISQVAEISISAERLPNYDTGSLSDPFCITYLRAFNAPEDAWIRFHTTETVKDNLNPNFAEKPLIPPSYGNKYTIKFELWDSDLNSSANDLLGFSIVSLKDILANDSKTLKIQKSQRVLKKEITSSTSIIIVRVEYLIDNNDQVTMKMRATNIEKMDRKIGLVKANSDPYVEIFKRNPSATYTVVHRTETRDNDQNPQWGEFTETIKKLCNGEEERELKFVCSDWNKKGPKLIGEFSTSLGQLRNQFRNRERHNFTRFDQKTKQNKVGGTLEFEKFELLKRPTFTEFIRSGLKFHVNIAIDFSEANGNLQRPDSLHFLNPNAANPNKYEQAIHSVMTILQDYDYNKSFQVFGFGARVGKGTPTPDKVFPIDPDAPECTGVQGVLSAYRKFLSGGNVTFTRPVSFAPVLQKFVDTIRTPQMSQDDFFIIVIFTAGEISDVPRTEAVIQTASQLAISIIIVGVGDSKNGSKFVEMERLDGDHLQKLISGVRVARDIVQFVTLDQHVVGGFIDTTASLSLAKELLAELPEQVINHMNVQHFMPRNVFGTQPQMFGAPMYGNMMGQPQMMMPNYGQPQFMPQGAGFGANGQGYGGFSAQYGGYNMPQGGGYGMPQGTGYGGYGVPQGPGYGTAQPQMQQNPGVPHLQSQQMQHSPSQHPR